MISSKTIKYIFLTVLAFTITNCGSGDGGGEIIVEEKPTAAILISPLKDAACNQGNVVSDLESQVLFEWNASDHTDKYTVTIKNLDNQTTETFDSTNPSLQKNVLKGVPYSWNVTSKSNTSSETAISETWKFYNAGDGTKNYAPFPADLVSPTMGKTVETSTSIEWTGSDVDGDIEEYDVYVATVSPPTTLKGTTSATSMDNLSLESGKVYYWKIVTKDTHGNNSESPVFEFRTK